MDILEELSSTVVQKRVNPRAKHRVILERASSFVTNISST